MPANTTQTSATAALTNEEGRSLTVYAGASAPTDEADPPEEDGTRNNDDLIAAGITTAPRTNISEDSRENTPGIDGVNNPTPVKVTPVTTETSGGGTDPTITNARVTPTANPPTTTTPPIQVIDTTTPAPDPTAPATNTSTTPVPNTTTSNPEPDITPASDPTTPPPTTTTSTTDPQPDHGKDTRHGHNDADDDDDSNSLLDGITDLLGGLFD